MLAVRPRVVALAIAAMVAAGAGVAWRTTALRPSTFDRAAARAGCRRLHSENYHPGLVHVAPGETVRYTTTPPIGGAHYNVPGLAPARTGVHAAPLQNEIQVHNLEHGHVGIQYHDLSSALVAAFEGIAHDTPEWVFVAPYPAMREDKVALSAWGRLVTCPHPNAKVVALAARFVADFHDHSPESIPGTPTGSGQPAE